MEAERQKIDQYLKQGGRLFVLFNYFSVKHPTGLEPVLARWGVNVIPDVVQEHDPITSERQGRDHLQFQFASRRQSVDRTGRAIDFAAARWSL